MHLSDEAIANMTVAEIRAMIEKGNKGNALRCKVSEKGAVSVYGLNVKFPVTLYAEQWERLMAYGNELKSFIKANNGKLKRKDA